jgi:methylphosphotriester-DNA--protein-cysteine methyltransferase
MEPIILVNTVIRFIESRIQSNIDYDEMEKATGFSYRHIREVFKTYTNIPLKHYIDQRKAAHIAFDIENSARSLTDLAADYGFEAYDSKP